MNPPGPAPSGLAPRTPPKVRRPVPSPRVDSPVIARLAADLAGARDEGGRRQVLDAFWSGRRSPVVEPSGDAWDVTFLWRDAAAEEVLLFVNRLTDERDLDRSLMERLPGTDVWHLAYRLRGTGGGPTPSCRSCRAGRRAGGTCPSRRPCAPCWTGGCPTR